MFHWVPCLADVIDHAHCRRPLQTRGSAPTANVTFSTWLSPHLTGHLLHPSLPHYSPSNRYPSPLPPATLHSFRRLHCIDISSFLSDLKSSRLITHPPKSLGSLLIAYNTTLSSLLTHLSSSNSPDVGLHPTFVYFCPLCF